MSAFAFDTHAFIKRLVAAGMCEAQAEILAEQRAELIGSRIATKVDLKRLERGLTIRFGVMMIAFGGALGALRLLWR